MSESCKVTFLSVKFEEKCFMDFELVSLSSLSLRMQASIAEDANEPLPLQHLNMRMVFSTTFLC